MSICVQLTDRQKRELDYHREHARTAGVALLSSPFNWEILANPSRRWWNAHWQMYAFLKRLRLSGQRMLVVGCGFGHDALLLARLGAEVYAFDLSSECLDIAKALAAREGLSIQFDQMLAEQLDYKDDFFDFVLTRDILHHVDMPAALAEIRRVCKSDAVLVVNEVYSHSLTEVVRRSRLVEEHLYPAMRRFVHGSDQTYITDDERKLNEKDLLILPLVKCWLEQHFNFIVNRLIPDRYTPLAKMDRALLMLLKPIGRLLAGRVLLAGPIAK